MKTTKEKIAVMQAFQDGKKIENRLAADDYSSAGAWGPIGDRPYEPLWDWNTYDYRVAHEPKLRPWKPEEVPVGALIRLKPGNFNILPSLICSANSGCFSYTAFSSVETLRFKAALDDYEHSTDHGKTWQPCGIIE